MMKIVSNPPGFESAGHPRHAAPRTCEVGVAAACSRGAQRKTRRLTRVSTPVAVRTTTAASTPPPSTFDTAQLEQGTSQLRDSYGSDRQTMSVRARAAGDELTALGGAEEGGVRRGTDGCTPRYKPGIYATPPSLNTSPHVPTHRPRSALQALGPRALARSHPICSRLRMPRHTHARARASAAPDTRGMCFSVRMRVLAHFVHGHAASLATECAPFGRVSRRRWGASESRIERDPPRDPVGSGRARGWQVNLRDVSPCADGFLRTVGSRASAAHLRTLSPACSSPRNEGKRLRCDKLRATPSFVCSGLGTHGYCTGTPPSTSRRHPVSCAAIPTVFTH
ncbi:uncharacterized protein TRAVEDRAFT_74568 [Trametes versicolor FP-101664 SS1]|uniref:uncharacterized protein n=1 Tax=Trametes versicolor (strain FP-101664) TaxID=717944 RepID=UPI0004621B6D|nr:uncharacterized protein TRAVEDRAFT_74568 [Trametes versicolor FP-101664 SS1]EIW54563.1 hypothetical protein TRAVEDRAFT_74568 [Trametes versicolor FP-101664 SS1]